MVFQVLSVRGERWFNREIWGQLKADAHSYQPTPEGIIVLKPDCKEQALIYDLFKAFD